MRKLTKKIWKNFFKKIFLIILSISISLSFFYLIGFFSYVKFDLDLLNLFSYGTPNTVEFITSGFFILFIIATVLIIIGILIYLLWDWARTDVELEEENDEDDEDDDYESHYISAYEEENEWEK